MHLRTALTAACLLAAGAAWADGGTADPDASVPDASVGPGTVEEFDGSLPDASVGQGGADRDSPDEGDGRLVVLCRQSRDCDQGFACASGRCTWVGYRQAQGPGCLGSVASLGLLALGAVVVRRRRA